MKTKNFLCVITFTMVISGCNSAKVETADIRLGGWDYLWMEEVKSDLKNGESEFLPAYSQLLKEADEALAGGVDSVTFKNLVLAKN